MKPGLSLLLLSMFGTSMLLRSENPERSIIYTLTGKESLVTNEYVLSLNANAYRTSFVVTESNYDSTTYSYSEKYRFYIDSKLICEFDEAMSSGSKSKIYYLNLNEENGYIYVYSKEGKWFFNNKGKIDGPYDDINHLAFNDLGFAYKKKDQWYEYDGNKVTGPFKGGTPASMEGTINSKGDFIFAYYDENGYWINYNNKTIGFFEEVNSKTFLSKNGNYMFCFKKNEQWYIRVEKKEFGPYLNVTHYIMNDAGDFGFVAEDLSNNFIININGVIKQSPGIVNKFDFLSPDFYAFVYVKEDGAFMLNLAGEEFGDFQYVEDISLARGKKYKYSYVKDDQKYLMHNEILYGPYLNLYTTEYNTDKDELAFIFESEVNNTKVMKNGVEIDYNEYEKSYNESMKSNLAPGFTAFKSGNNKFELEIEYKGVIHKLVQNWTDECIKIDDKNFGKANSLNCMYDDKSNAFVWIALEDKELVLYKYSL